MKYLFLVFCLNLALFGYAQKKSGEVSQNDRKIEELNSRLDKLVGESKTITVDSVSYKIDLLMVELEKLKKEMQEIRHSVDELQPTDQKSAAAFDSKMDEIADGKYYVVIASERKGKDAESKLKAFQNSYNVKLVQNQRKSWYHIILIKPFSMVDAIQETAIIRQKAIKDAWWVNSKKLLF